MNTKYIQNIEKIHESTQKGKYFMIMTKIDYKKVMIEVNELVKYIYPDIPTEDLQTSRKKTDYSHQCPHLRSSSHDISWIKYSPRKIIQQTTQTSILWRF